MRGNALLNQGLMKKDPSFFTDAEGYYRKATEANSKYSRAYVGLATVLYERARSEGDASHDYGKVPPELLDASIRTYQQALQPDMERPPLADVESKVSFGLGQAYLLKALVLLYGGQPEQASEFLLQAVQAFQNVIDEYQGASTESQKKRLQERAAHSHARIGFIYRSANHLAEAEQQYALALELMPKLARTNLDRAKYEAALGDIKVKQGKLQDAKSWYEKAAAHAPDGSKEKPEYQTKLAEIQAQNDAGGQ
jgi:tetratricopeptide (TPR) repeat protein